MAEVYQDMFAIELGALCNNHCVFCVQAGQGSDASEALGVKVADELNRARTMGIKSVIFVGGEPTMHEGLIEWISLAKQLSFEDVSVQSNGRRFSQRKYVEEISNAGLTHAEVSLQGHYAAVHDYHTQTPGSFRETAKGLLNLRSTDVTVGISTVITRSNFRVLEGVSAMCAHVQASAWHVAPSEPIGAAVADIQRVVPNLNMLLPYLTRAVERCTENGVTPHIRGIPLCLLASTHRAYSLENNSSQKDNRLALDDCKECVEQTSCSGISVQYNEQFDVNGISRITGNGSEEATIGELFPFAGIGRF